MLILYQNRAQLSVVLLEGYETVQRDSNGLVIPPKEVRRLEKEKKAREKKEKKAEEKEKKRKEKEDAKNRCDFNRRILIS